jgi:probable F420-dependent oxidoreductase
MNSSSQHQSTIPAIGRIGIWSLQLRFGDRAEASEAAAELDELGYGALWIPGGIGGDVQGDVDRLLAATKRSVIATGILNLWKHEAKDVGAWWQALSQEHQSRVLLGIGVSHSHNIGEAYRQPLHAMREYLDKLDAAGVPANSLCLAALGPKMLELARDRTAGAHPYLVTPEHTAIARAALGPGKLVAPEQGVVLETDPDRARAMARQALKQYITYPNYTNSWKRLGFSDDEITSASDRLVDALFAWGTVEAIAKRVNEHFAAGADHVCLQVITGGGVTVGPARPVWRELAAALI